MAHTCHQQSPGGRAPLSKPQGTPYQEWERQISQRIILDSIHEPRVEGDEGPPDKSGTANDCFDDQPGSPLQSGWRCPGYNEGGNDQPCQGIGHPPFHHFWAQVIPAHRAGVDQADHIEGGVYGRTQKARQPDKTGNIAGAFHLVLKPDESVKQKRAYDCANGVADGSAKGKKTKRHTIEQSKKHRAQCNSWPKSIPKQQNCR